MFDQTLIRVCLILGSFITAGYILRRVRHAKVQIEDTIFWLMFSFVLILVSIFPEIADWLSMRLGIYSTVNMVFLIIIFALLLRVFLLTIKISQMEHRVSILVEELANREKDSRKAKQKKWIRPEMKILDLKEQQTEHSEK